jgi:hypothetical protein
MGGLITSFGWAQEPPKATAPPAIPIHFHLAAPGYVTLVIEKPDGTRVRNLISDTHFPAGDQTVPWDGLDDLGRDSQGAKSGIYHIPGKLVEPGDYRIRGLVHPELDLLYQMSVYNEGNPPWRTKDRASEWLANHTAPSAVLFVPENPAPARPGHPAPGGQVLVGSLVAEGGSGLAWLNLDGGKIFGQMWVGGVWTGATQLAIDQGDNPVPGVYAYTGASWKGDKYNGNRPELRLHELVTDKVKAPRDKREGEGDDRPLLQPNLTLPQGAQSTDALTGMAVHNGIVVVAIGPANELIFIDGRQHKVLGQANVPKPAGLSFDHQGRLLVLSGTQLVRYELPQMPPAAADQQNLPQIQLPNPQVLVKQGLDDPRQLTLDSAGNVYVTDRGNSNQVKVFSPDGQFQHAIGHAGRPKLGIYDPEQMHEPNGITLDSRGHLWVAETDMHPKRLSVWTLEGKLVDAYYGPPRYGGGGELDPRDKNRFFMDGMSFALDWNTGRSKPLDVFFYPGANDYLKPQSLKPGQAVPEAALKAPTDFLHYGGSAPQTPIYFNDVQYMTNAFSASPTAGARLVGLWKMEQGVARPLVIMGQASEWGLFKLLGKEGATDPYLSAWQARLTQETGLKEANPKGATPKGIDLSKNAVFFLWQDANGDGRLHPDETRFVRLDQSNNGIAFMNDLSAVIYNYQGHVVRFQPTGISAEGVPQYDLEHPQVLADAQRPPGDGGGQALLCDQGWLLCTTASKPFSGYGPGGVKEGKPLWSYPSLWPGLHDSHRAQLIDIPGVMVGTTRLLGMPVHANDDIGQVWAINGNKGQVYLMTTDGLFLATLFRDSRTASWDFESSTRGMRVNEASLHEENFWPSITQTADGEVYLQVHNSQIVKINGLDKVHRLPAQTISITAGQLAAAQAARLQAEAQRQQTSKDRQLMVRLRQQPPKVDGKLDDWQGAQWVTIDQRHVASGSFSNARSTTSAALAVAGDRLYVAYDTDDPNLINNSLQSRQNLFKTGGALDLMLSTTQADKPHSQAAPGDLRLLVARDKKQTAAMLYRQKTADPTPPGEGADFASPLRSVHFDQLQDVSDQVELASGAYTPAKSKIAHAVFEFSIPLKVLGLNPQPNEVILGDIGVLRGNGFETLQRVYWSNKASGLVSDIPSEAELTPALWGQMKFIADSGQ